MRKIFVKTSNVRNFIGLVENLNNKPKNIPKMALIYGEPGLGKSQTMLIDFANYIKSKYKPKTASNGVTLLGSIFKCAFMEGYLKSNPYLGIINSKCK